MAIRLELSFFVYTFVKEINYQSKHTTMNIDEINPKSNKLKEKQAFLKCLPKVCKEGKEAFLCFEESIDEYFSNHKRGKDALFWCMRELSQKTPKWMADIAFRMGLSSVVAWCCPKYFDADKFNWKEDSWVVAKYCPQHLDSNLYSWSEFSWAVAKYCPRHLNPEKFNWSRHSWAVADYCPHLLKLRPQF